MMEAIRGWLLGVTGAAILAALAESLMPPGPVRRVGQLVCGLLLLLAVIRPAVELGPGAAAQAHTLWQSEQQALTQSLETERRAQLKVVIERQCAAYISDKAKELGLACAVEVACAWGDEDLCLPVGARISGSLSPAQREALARAAEDLGLLPDDITFTEEETP